MPEHQEHQGQEHQGQGHQGQEHQEHQEHQGQSDHAGHQNHHEMMVADFRRRFWISIVVTVPVLLLSPLIQDLLGLEALAFPGDSYILLALSTFIFGYGGYPFLSGAADELKKAHPGMMTLVAMAITTAFAYSAAVVLGLSGEVFFWELATLVDIMLLGHWVEMRSVMGASKALEELASLMPDEAHLLQEDGSTEDVPVADLKGGDRVLVKPGEKVPVDGRVVEGRSSLNEAMLTGESRPVEKGEEDEVIAGSVNGEGSLQVEMEKKGEDTYLSQVIRLVQEAQESRSRSQDLADRAAMWLTIVAITAGAITLAAWLLAGRTFEYALGRTITVMVITCPHALGLAIPLVVAVSTALAARHGLLIRDRSAFERSRNLQAVVFDKTGTLTQGQFGVEQAVSVNPDSLEEEEILRLAGAVESHSEHPIAQGVVQAAGDRNLSLPAVRDFQSIPGKGAEGKVEDRLLRVVSPGYLREEGHLREDLADDTDDTGDRVEDRIKDLMPALSQAQERGHTVVYLLEDQEILGAIALADKIRPESKEAVQKLHDLGIQAMMLTGDNQTVASWVAEELGLDDYFAQVLPDQKSAKIKEIQDRGLLVGMVGDGVNDAPALVQADVGIAIGAGTDVAIESADVVLVKNDPRNVLDMLSLAQATWKKMLQNLAWATGYNVVAIPLAAGALYGVGVVLSPAMGAVLMSASTVIVAVNARFLRMEEAGD